MTTSSSAIAEGQVDHANSSLLVRGRAILATMSSRSNIPSHVPARNRQLFVLVGIATFLSIGHHLDHLARGNHLGWPLTSQVTPFTFSFIVYPLIVLGVLLRVWGKGGPGYWAVLAGAGFVLVGTTHLGPFAAEPPQDIIEPYRFCVVGWAAFGLLVALLVTLATLAVYASRCWRGQGI